MTVTMQAPAPVTPNQSPQLLRQMRSEQIKLMSTKTWWLFGIGIVVATILTLLINIGSAYSDLFSDNSLDGSKASLTATHAADIFTSGQYLGGLFVMLLAILLITNEYYHQTATSTFLATPHRTTVILGKFVVAMIAAAVVWLFTTVVDLIGGVIFFNANSSPNDLDTSAVGRAILINLMMFALWAIFGVGVGALLRSQIGATVTSALLYTVGIPVTYLVLAAIHQFIWSSHHVYQASILVPGVAAQVAESASRHQVIGGASVPWWAGIVVMVAYGVIMSTVGTLILRKRDIS
jgi:ABC-2 type transport system permease protein